MEHFLTLKQLESLLGELRGEGYGIVGPTIDQGAIVYGEITSVDDLPRGWTDEQSPGHYRLKQRDDGAFFGYVVGPHSWKKYLFPPHVALLRTQKTGDGWNFETPPHNAPKLALLGVRACELAAIAIQDRVFMGGEHVDPLYAERRANLFLIAVNCTQAAATCFCVSMETGPHCKSGFDLALTEIDGGFVAEAGNDRGKARAGSSRGTTGRRKRKQDCGRKTTSGNEATAGDRYQQSSRPAAKQPAASSLEGGRRSVPLLHNCTMVCPTCFCSSVEEVSDLAGENFERHRHWDSCFNLGFSYMNGGAVRPDTRSRYRQWLTHKLATWIDQFGTSGCVGCGRCITWCPVGIDLTQEVAALGETLP